MILYHIIYISYIFLLTTNWLINMVDSRETTKIQSYVRGTNVGEYPWKTTVPGKIFKFAMVFIQYLHQIAQSSISKEWKSYPIEVSETEIRWYWSIADHFLNLKTFVFKFLGILSHVFFFLFLVFKIAMQMTYLLSTVSPSKLS